jgi:hypothetical protein
LANAYDFTHSQNYSPINAGFSGNIFIVIEEVYKHNLEALAQSNQGVSEWISSVDISAQQSHYYVTSQLARLQANSFHDALNPFGEAEILAEQWLAITETEGPVCVLGFGLGFHIEALLTKMPQEKKLNVQLLDRTLFQLALKNRDMSHFLGDSRLGFVSNLTVKTAFMIDSFATVYVPDA